MQLTQRNPLIRIASTIVLAAGLILAPVSGVVAGEDIVTQTVPGPFDKVDTDLKRAITAQQLVIVKEVPFQQMLAMVGLTTEKLKSFEVFHPRYGKVLYEKTGAAAMREAPLRIVVRETGSEVTLEYRKPSAVFAPYPELTNLGAELDQLFANIVASLGR